MHQSLRFFIENQLDLARLAGFVIQTGGRVLINGIRTDALLRLLANILQIYAKKFGEKRNQIRGLGNQQNSSNSLPISYIIFRMVAILFSTNLNIVKG